MKSEQVLVNDRSKGQGVSMGHQPLCTFAIFLLFDIAIIVVYEIIISLLFLMFILKDFIYILIYCVNELDITTVLFVCLRDSYLL